MRIGKHKIIGLLLDRDLSLTELAKRSKLTKPTVIHHLTNLQKQGLLKFDKKTRTYSISIKPEVKSALLSLLIEEKSLEQLVEELKVRGKTNSELQMLVRDKEFVDKLDDLLEVLYGEGLVTEFEKGTSIGVDGSFTRFSDVWTLTWLGCQELKICYVCKRPFNSEHYAVANILDTGGGGITSYFAPLIHPRCISTLEEQNSEIDLSLNDSCDFCGLSLSERRLRWGLEYTNKNKGFAIVYNLLRKSEIEALNRWRKARLEEEFRAEWGIEPPNGMFDGDVIQRKKFTLTIDKKLSSKITEKTGKNLHGLFRKDETVKLDLRSKENPFDFLKEPRISDLDRLFEIIKAGSKEKDPNIEPELRIKEIFTEWIRIENEENERTERLISELFGDIRSQIYQKLEPISPRNAGKNERDLLIYGEPAQPESIGHSFIRIEGDKKYHIGCYQKMIESKSVIITESKDEGHNLRGNRK